MLTGHIMTRKIVTIGLDDPVHAVRELFEQHGFHHLLVVGDSGRLAGVISDRDLLKNLSPFIGGVMERNEDRSLLKRRVHQIMRRKPITVDRNTLVSDAAVTLLQNRVSCLPVVDEDGRPIGMITRTDLLAAAYEEACTLGGKILASHTAA